MAANFPRLEIHRFIVETPFRRVFRSCKTTLWHTSAISQPPVHSFRSCEMAANFPCLENPSFHSISTIFSIVGHISITSRNPFHAYHMSFRRSGSQESNASNGVRIGVEMKKLCPFEDKCGNHEWKCCSRTPHFATVGHISKYFLKSISCIPYFVSKLGKSGVQRFKRYTIWS